MKQSNKRKNIQRADFILLKTFSLLRFLPDFLYHSVSMISA